MTGSNSRAALVGAGVIGGGWAGRLIENGIDVSVYDPSPAAANRLREMVANADRAWAKLTYAPRTRKGGVTFAATLQEAVQGAAFIQESAPEDEGLKRRLLADIDRHARGDAIIASSTSGLLPSRLQSDMTHPERLVVGHPFNPVYLLPLVEVCGGAKTSAATIERAMQFYSSLGMRPLRIRKEIDGFVADRLLEALWREALWLVHDDVATTAEVDDAIRYGAGLRWAQMGTFLVYRIAGGEAGFRHFMAQFGPALKWPWTKLMDVPELTDAFLDKLSAQSDAQAEGVSIGDLERTRDDNLVAILQALRGENFAAGAVLRAHEGRQLDAVHAIATPVDETRPLQLFRCEVRSDWVDYNGHMTESRYLEVCGHATDALLAHIGCNAQYRAQGLSFYTVETHLRFLAEIRSGEKVKVATQVLGSDDKRLHLFHSLLDVQGERPIATAENMLLHVDTRTGKSMPMRPGTLAAARRVTAAHKSLTRPDGAERSIALTRPKAERSADG